MMRRVLPGLFLVMTLMASSHADEEFLDPEDAFRFSARLVATGMLEVRYLIAKGYYMYRDRYGFDVEPASITLGLPQFPDGHWHEDDFFGRSEIFRDEVIIRVPIVSPPKARQTIRLVAVSQGCADAGICYLPTTQTRDFELFGDLDNPGNSQ